MKELEMYSISGYGSMIADRMRMDAYMRALRRVVKPGSAIMDIGTGAGIFALLACQLGARRVYAIEIGDAIEIAREIAVSSGYADRIEFIQKRSTQVTLHERVDVIISDLRGVLPFFQHHIPAIADARKRFLGPGGTLIPQRDTLWVTAVEAPELYGRHMTPWEDFHGLKMEAARRIVTNTWWKDRVRPEQFLAEPTCWATLDYIEIESPDIQGEVTLTVARAGISHGFIVWFDATLAEDVHFSNAPGEVELIYGSAFFPWSKPLPLAVGDMVSVSLEARLVGEDYVWNWTTHVSDGDRGGESKAHFKQSTFFGAPLSPMRLRKRADSYVPALNEDGQIDRLILELMNDRMPLGNIAHRMLAQFPSRFPTWRDALTRVADLSGKYT